MPPTQARIFPHSNLVGLRLAILLLLIPSALGQSITPRFSTVIAETNSLYMEWTTAGADQAYTLQARTALGAGLWSLPTGPLPWPIDSTEVRLPLPTHPTAQFYRVLAVPRADRGRLLSVTPLDSFTTNQLQLLFSLTGIPVTPTHNISTFKFLYETIDPWGSRITASGALALPQDPTLPLPLVSYQHGTVTEPTNTPSGTLLQRLPGIGFAATGYACSMPDFLGLGESPGFHPYHHARSEATAAIDLLRAIRTWSTTNAANFNDQLFLCGYSQGGHATLALHRELELHHPNEFTVTASAPMAGAHDLSGVTFDDLLSGRPLPNPYYLPYLLAAYQDVYRITNVWTDWVAAPYDTTLPPLLESRAGSAEINAAMTNNARLLFRPEVLHALETNPQHPLRLALRDNDLYRWLPQAPLRIIHCRGDLDVPFDNAIVASTSFLSQGASHVVVIDPNSVAGHTDCVLPAFLLMKEWFDSLANSP